MKLFGCTVFPIVHNRENSTMLAITGLDDSFDGG